MIESQFLASKGQWVDQDIVMSSKFTPIRSKKQRIKGARSLLIFIKRSVLVNIIMRL